jgi:hypothetical protein
MSTNWIFYTQILSLFTYVGIALGLYALLVKQKDATRSKSLKSTSGLTPR